MLQGYVKNIHCARSDTHSYHTCSCGETHFNDMVNVKLRQSLERECRSKSPGHSECCKGMLRTFTVQDLTLAGNIATEKCTLMLGST